MKPFEKILVSIDSAVGRQPAVEKSILLARAYSSKLTLFHVDQTTPEFYRSLLGEYANVDAPQRNPEFEELAQQIAASGVAAQFKTVCGRPFVEIIREAVQGNYDLVVRGAYHATAGATSKGFSPIEMRLLRQCPCPVWIVREKEKSDVRPNIPPRVTAAVEPVRRDFVRASVSRQILELASSLASLENAEFSVVSAWEVPGGRQWLSSQLSPKKLLELIGIIESEARRAIDELLDIGLPVQPTTVHFEEGDAAEVIIEIVRKITPGVLVMGSVSQLGVFGLLIGNTAEKVFHQLDCSLLSIKPANFVSPAASL